VVPNNPKIFCWCVVAAVVRAFVSWCQNPTATRTSWVKISSFPRKRAVSGTQHGALQKVKRRQTIESNPDRPPKRAAGVVILRPQGCRLEQCLCVFSARTRVAFEAQQASDSLGFFARSRSLGVVLRHRLCGHTCGNTAHPAHPEVTHTLGSARYLCTRAYASSILPKRRIPARPAHSGKTIPPTDRRLPGTHILQYAQGPVPSFCPSL
jgi:hypothetical protein